MTSVCFILDFTALLLSVSPCSYHALLPSALAGALGNVVRACRAYTVLGLKLPAQLTSEAASPAGVAASEVDVPIQVPVSPFSSCTEAELLGLEHELRCLQLADINHNSHHMAHTFRQQTAEVRMCMLLLVVLRNLLPWMSWYT